MKKLNTVLLVLGLAFLAYLVWNVGPARLWQQVSALGWGVIPLILSEGAGNLAHTLGWRNCIDGRHPRVPLFRLFRMAMAGYAINYLTPTACVGGEVSKAALLASTQKGSDAASSVLLDKLSTAFAHLVLAVVGALVLIWSVRLPPALLVSMVVTTGLLICAMAAFLLLQKHGKLGSLCRWLVAHKLGGRPLEQAATHVSEVDDALKHFYREHPTRMVLSIWWHLLGHSAAILQAWLFLWLLKQPAPLATVAGAGFLSLWFDLLTFVIPLNLGTLEGSRIVTFKALGCPALLGMTFGVAVRIAQVFWACFGLVSYGLFAMRKPGSPPALARSPGSA